MMAPLRRASLAAAAIACCTLAAPAVADEFSEYRIPPHSLFSWIGDAQGNASRSTRDLTPERSRQDALQGRASTRLWRAHDADAGSWRLDAGLDLNGSRTRFDRAAYADFIGVVQQTGERRNTRHAGERWTVGYSQNAYAGRSPWALGGDVRLAGDHDQAWSSSRQTVLATSNIATSDQWTEAHVRQRRAQTVAFAQVHAGIGRVRDATSVYLASVLEHRLRAGGALSRPLSPSARQRLVHLLALSGAVADVRSRPAKPLWAEIERTLIADGALSDAGLDAASVQRAGEPLLETLARGRTTTGIPGPVVVRWRGTRAGLFVRGEHDRVTEFHASGSRSQLTVDGVPGPVLASEASDATATASDAVHAGVLAAWHRPLGMRLQLDAQASAAIPVRPGDDGFSVDADAGATWLIADRWWARASMSQRRHVERSGSESAPQEDRWSFACGADLAYEVEDHVTIRLGLRDQQWNSRGPSTVSASANAYDRSQDAFLGVTYRFAGRFSAPGFPALSEPMRVTPGP
jgi:hypothetical protein